MSADSSKLENVASTPPTGYDNQNGSNSKQEIEEDKEGFSSRWAFWFAAVGCSVGFGNVWRFPYLVYKNGGGAFFIPYIIMLALVVWPVCVLELGLGQLNRRTNVVAFNPLGPRARGSALAGFVAFNISTYYHLLLSWSLIYMINSFRRQLPWAPSDASKAECESLLTLADCTLNASCAWNRVTEVCTASAQLKAQAFFESETGCNAKSDYWRGFYSFGGPNFGGIVASWVLGYITLVFGAKVLGYVMYVTMSLPAIFLITLVIAGATLSGSKDGVRKYIGYFDMKSLKNMTPWVEATGQGVFSVGCSQGTLAAYSCHNAKRQNFVQDSYVIIVADTFFAFLAGFAVFEVVGYLAQNSGVALEELDLKGKGLAFMTYPVGLSSLKYPGAQILSVLFFMTLWLLGMDTLVGLVEACVGITMDTRTAEEKRWKRWKVLLCYCAFIGIVYGPLLSTNIGSVFLDAIDHFSSDIVQSFGAGTHALCAGWLFLSSDTQRIVGRLAYWVHFGTWIGGSSIAFIIIQASSAPAGIGVGLGLWVVGTIAAIFLTNKQDLDGRTMSLKERAYCLTFRNVEVLRSLLNEEGCRNTCWVVPVLWSIFIKYITPVVTSYMFWSTVLDSSLMYKSPAGGVTWPWYVFLVGQLGPFLLLLSIIVFSLVPQWLSWMIPASRSGFYFTPDTMITDDGPVNPKKVGDGYPVGVDDN